MATMMRLVIVAALVAAVNATKDSSYYPGGIQNPNVNNPMYWKDSRNVLEDLSQFQSLYIRYHSCAWSPIYQTTSTSQNSEDDDVYENAYWYRGITPIEGPNVAFSLYGSLAGNSFKGCTAKTYINSFYTTNGFTTFLKKMSSAGYVSSYDSSLSSYCQGSYGVGCDAGSFAMLAYNSKVCSANTVAGVVDSLDSTNQALQAVDCVEIFDADDYSNGDYGLVGMLQYAEACSFDKSHCPDPYLKQMEYRLRFASGDMTAAGIQQHNQKAAYSMMGVGIACFVLALLATCCDRVTIKRRANKTTPAIEAGGDGLVKPAGDAIMKKEPPMKVKDVHDRNTIEMTSWIPCPGPEPEDASTKADKDVDATESVLSASPEEILAMTNSALSMNQSALDKALDNKDDGDDNSIVTGPYMDGSTLASGSLLTAAMPTVVVNKVPNSPKKGLLGRFRRNR